jgi:hypothetical protein
MTPLQPPLSEQRRVLRDRLQAQRELIAARLEPGAAVPSDYPRSVTMRLLGQRPGMLISLVTGLATLLRSR